MININEKTDILNNYPSIEEKNSKVIFNNKNEFKETKSELHKKGKSYKNEINNFPIIIKEIPKKNIEENSTDEKIHLITKKIKNHEIDVIF